MVGTSGGHDFFRTESGSDVETFDNFGEHEAKEDELLHGCDSYGASDEDLIFIKPSPSGVHEDKFEPFIGMIFPSLDAARDFYYEYAKNTGFTIRTNRIRHSQKNMAIIGRDFVCSREGFRAAKHALKKDRVVPPRPITREGCKAMIRLAAKDVGSWIVTKFVRDHSHKLMTKCNFAGELPTVNILSEGLVSCLWNLLDMLHNCACSRVALKLAALGMVVAKDGNISFGNVVRYKSHRSFLRWSGNRSDGKRDPYYDGAQNVSEEEKDKKILELNNELQHEKERSSMFREQLHTILKDLEEHAEFMSIRVEDIVNTMKGIELDDD
ncbi:hypothetical protein RHSIM_RhsimUnG0143200 [Rhododendron simsii]|uniref:FAR1 domain-containing protein n=1 Tax=Rhododendron simsii TaxID=118357 RepID=A0A834FV18_RHOSS|nr:hypothetical protein RHSIM_RhsimUnG0143200 [Rhododendron simsii]